MRANAFRSFSNLEENNTDNLNLEENSKGWYSIRKKKDQKAMSFDTAGNRKNSKFLKGKIRSNFLPEIFWRNIPYAVFPLSQFLSANQHLDQGQITIGHMVYN